MDIIDAQLHLFQKVDIESGLAVMDALGVQGVLIDESWVAGAGASPQPSLPLPGGGVRPVALGGRMAAIKHPDRFRYLLRVNHRDPELKAVMRTAAQDPYCAAFRSLVWPEQFEDFKADLYRPVFEMAAEVGRTLFFQTFSESPALAPYLRDFPGCRVVIDHVGLVKTREAFEALLRLSEHPNLGLKWCHANLAFPPERFPFEPMQAALREAVDAFGKERVLWASDASMLRPQITWADALYYVRECPLLSEEERAWVLGRAARKWLGWPAPEAAAA